MDCCKSSQCTGIEETFDAELAAEELEDYRSKGPNKETHAMLTGIRAQGVDGARLLDIGGGVGVIQHELARYGAASIVNVDASPAYSTVARQEAEGLGYAARAEYRVGNFVDIAPELAPADVVTLDRVICCYDDMPGLVSAAVAKARRVLGVVYPVDRWFIRFGMFVANGFQALMRRPFRIFAHRNAAVEAIIAAGGFERKFYRRELFWQVAVYAKTAN